MNDTKKSLKSWHDANVKITERLTGASTHEIEYPMPDLHDEERIARVRLIIEREDGIAHEELVNDLSRWIHTPK